MDERVDGYNVERLGGCMNGWTDRLMDDEID